MFHYKPTISKKKQQFMETPKCCIESCLAAWNKVIFHLWLGMNTSITRFECIETTTKEKQLSS
jgi:hypothetical protein